MNGEEKPAGVTRGRRRPRRRIWYLLRPADRAAVLLAAAVVLAVLLAGVVAMVAAGPAAASSSPSPGGKVVLRIGWTNEPDNLNPFIGVNATDYEIWASTYDLLVAPATKDLKPSTNGLAQSWDVSQDGLTWTFHLHKGMKWQDGQPITADDVAFTYNFIIKNQVAAFSSLTLGITKAVALDPSTVQLVCDRPKADMLSIFVPILPEHIWKEVPAKLATSKYTNGPPYVGSGPFQVVEWKKGQYIRLEANKHYRLGSPKVDEILFETFTNADTMVQELKKGTIDAAYGIPPAEFLALRHAKGIQTAGYSWFNWAFMSINSYEGKSKGNPVLRDAAFRNALQYAIDRDKLVSIAWDGLAYPGYAPLPPKTWTDPDYSWKPSGAEQRPFDLAKARAALDAAGYRDTNGDGIREYKGKPVELRLWADSQAVEDQRAAKLIAGWLGQIGLKIDLQTVDQGVYNDHIWNMAGKTYEPDYDLLVWQFDGWSDPGETLSCWTTGQINGWNLSAWSSAAYDKQNAVQQTAIEPQKRAAALWAMQSLMWSGSPMIVITHPFKLEAYRTDAWQGWQRALNGNGPAFAGALNQLTYLKVQPKTVVAAASGGGRSAVAWIVVGVVVVVIVMGGTVLLTRRRKGRGIEE